MARPYPSKQTVFIAICCILAVGGMAFYVREEKIKVAQKNQPTIITGITGDIAEINTDTISTSTDWEKQFLVNSTSTSSQKPYEAPKKELAEEPETLTERFGKDFFEQFMLLKQNNQVDNPDAVKGIVDQSVDKFVNSATQPQVYDERNVTLSLDTSDIAKKTYANAIGSILAQYTPSDDSAMIAIKALQENDPSQVKTIENISSSYEAMLKALLLVKTPQTFVVNQVNLINAVSSMHFVSEGMSKVFSDPIQGLVALSKYEKSFQSFYDATLDLKYLFAKSGFQFSPSDPAFFITQLN